MTRVECRYTKVLCLQLLAQQMLSQTVLISLECKRNIWKEICSGWKGLIVIDIQHRLVRVLSEVLLTSCSSYVCVVCAL